MYTSCTRYRDDRVAVIPLLDAIPFGHRCLKIHCLLSAENIAGAYYVGAVCVDRDIERPLKNGHHFSGMPTATKNNEKVYGGSLSANLGELGLLRYHQRDKNGLI